MKRFPLLLSIVSFMFITSYQPYELTERIVQKDKNQSVNLSFKKIKSIDEKRTIYNKYGYSTYHVDIYKMPFTPVSSLYLINAPTIFVPGKIADINNKGYFDSNAYLGKGYIHLAPMQFRNDTSHLLGGNIAVKGYWPNSTSITTTVTSSFGVEYNLSSVTEGEVGSQGFSISKSNSSNFAIDIEYSVSSTADDPIISFQKDPYNSKELQWNYEVQNISVAGAISYTISPWILIEINNSQSNTNKDAFCLQYEVMMNNMQPILWWYDEIGENTFTTNITC